MFHREQKRNRPEPLSESHIMSNLFKFLDPLFLVSTLGTLGIIAIIFAESGLFFGFFLPGDSLLFTAGLVASQGYINIWVLLIGTSIAAVLGDSVGYAFGRKVGPKLFNKEDSRFFKKAYLERTKTFYERHGKKTIILARFLPIFRTFAPFVAGIGKMEYKSFCVFNIVGAIAWVSLFLALGFYFGAIPIVKENFEFVIVGIIFISFLPIIIRTINGYLASKH